VIVTPTGGSASNSVTYTVNAPTPASANISALAPTHGLAGSSVTITGSALGTAGVVTIGGTTATTSAWTATSITATVPATLTPGAAAVIVTPTGGSASNTATYTVDAPSTTPGTATIISLSPTQGRAGTTVTITGTDFGCSGYLPRAKSNAVLEVGVACLPNVLAARGDDNEHADHTTYGTVRFGNVTAKVISWTATTIVVKVPSDAHAGIVSVTVTPMGGTASNSVSFTIVRGGHGDDGHGDGGQHND
jgi:hypothetical protein